MRCQQTFPLIDFAKNVCHGRLCAVETLVSTARRLPRQFDLPVKALEAKWKELCHQSLSIDRAFYWVGLERVFFRSLPFGNPWTAGTATTSPPGSCHGGWRWQGSSAQSAAGPGQCTSAHSWQRSPLGWTPKRPKAEKKRKLLSIEASKQPLHWNTTFASECEQLKVVSTFCFR